jgi:CelD/BcsL family acetyltransferase involved in cellulose biosynthesis
MPKLPLLQVTDAVDRPAWDRLVQRFGGTIFHSSVWADYVHAQTPNVQPLFAHLMPPEDSSRVPPRNSRVGTHAGANIMGSLPETQNDIASGNDPIGLALMFAEVSHRKAMAPLTGVLRTEAAPLLNRECVDAPTVFAKAVEAFARRRGISALSIGSFGGTPDVAAFTQLGFTQTRYWEFSLDLSASEENLLQCMDAHRRQKIRKAERRGVLLEDCSRVEGIPTLRRLQKASSERIVARGGPDIGRRNDQAADALDVLMNSGLGRIVCAKVDGQIVSASLFTCFNGVVYHTLSGHSEEALRTQAPTLLLWETIKRYKAEGARWFNFGGCSADAADEEHPEHGVYVYKKDFGGNRIECVTFDKVLFPVRHGVGVLLREPGRLWRQHATRRCHG